MPQYKPTEVFTPTTYAKLAFVDRAEINDRLVDALNQPGMQVVIYGASGSGKSTLIYNKLHQVYERHITTKCTSATTYDQILFSAFDQLDKYFVSTHSSARERSASASAEAAYAALKLQIGSSVTDSTNVEKQRVIPPQLTAERLAQFLGEVRCAWILEDFHKVPDTEKAKVAQIMKLFMDTAAEYPDVKMIAVGAVGTARQVIAYDPEMKHRVSEIRVPLMTFREITGILDQGGSLLGLSFGADVKREIATYSCGLGAVAHQLALNICHVLGMVQTAYEEIEVTRDHMTSAIEKYLKNSSDTLVSVFDKAMKRSRSKKYDNCRIIAHAMSHLPLVGATHNQILREIRKWHPDYPSGNLTTYLRDMQTPVRGQLVRHDPCSGTFAFADPFYKAYAMCLFGKPQSGATVTFKLGSSLDSATMRELLGKMMGEVEKQMQEIVKNHQKAEQ